MAFNLDVHVDNAMGAVIGAVGVSMAFGIGLYILAKLRDAAGQVNGTYVLQPAYDMLNNTSNVVGAVVTFLAIGAIAGIGIGLVNYLRSIRSRTAE